MSVPVSPRGRKSFAPRLATDHNAWRRQPARAGWSGNQGSVRCEERPCPSKSVCGPIRRMWRVPRGTLNLGILAHVDAGKTTLTERLLYCAGVIDAPGSVDAGTTQTDSLALERQRGITIKSAVVSFTVGGTTVNLIDTPGHPDFVAEVERALSVLDGVVLVVSAVEGVQPQTRILWRALRRLRVPTLFFVNKIDRRGAGYDRLLADIAERLTPAIIPMGSVHGLGMRGAAFIPHDRADPASAAELAEALAE